MRTAAWCRGAWLALCVALPGMGGGCALFSKAEVVEPRYFAPVMDGPSQADEGRPPPGDGAALRIGRISSGKHLRQRILFRSAHMELGEYADYRWTENPEEFVRRAVVRALFEDQGLTQAVGGPVPMVDLELISFEEVRRGDARSGRVEVTYTVRDDRVVLASRTVSVEQAASDSGEPMQSLVEAVSEALVQVSAKVAEEIAVAVRRPAPEGRPPEAPRTP